MTCLCVEFYVVSVLEKALRSRLLKPEKSGTKFNINFFEDLQYQYISRITREHVDKRFQVLVETTYMTLHAQNTFTDVLQWYEG
jgi:hypothetical protein